MYKMIGGSQIVDGLAVRVMDVVGKKMAIGQVTFYASQRVTDWKDEQGSTSFSGIDVTVSHIGSTNLRCQSDGGFLFAEDQVMILFYKTLR